ncbi:MAG: translation initiation factor IF-2 [Candidatus Aenigmatarchaeota archaeon]
MFRQPIVTVLGHVDHGKTTILDYMRSTGVAKREAGGITQDIGATNMPISLIFELAGGYLKPMKDKIKIPGLLFIDTPGHLAFTSMREKGGSIADLAVLVLDINEGIRPQTIESLEILRKFKTPFVIALTKIDRLAGWRMFEKDFIKNLTRQNDMARQEFDNMFYTRISELSEHGFNAELFSKVSDFTKEVAIVPCSGVTGEGILNLFVVLIGLSQKFLSEELRLSEQGRGMVLEVKKDEKLGNNIDIILYDGSLSVGDRVLVEGPEPFEVKVRGLLKPASLQDLRAEKRFINVEKIHASAGVKVIGRDVEKAGAGANFFVIHSEGEKKKILLELKSGKESKEIEGGDAGIIIRAHTIGNLEAALNLFQNVPIRRAKVGPPAKEDIMLLDNSPREDKAIICFGLQNPFPDLTKSKKIKVIEGNIIYRVYEEYIKWRADLELQMKAEEEGRMKKIAKVKFLPGFVFRQNNPAVIGVEVEEGVLEEKCRLINSEGKILGEVIQIQKEGVATKALEKEDRAAISVSGVTVGRQIREGETFYTFLTKEEYRELKNYEKANPELLEEIRRILGYR